MQISPGLKWNKSLEQGNVTAPRLTEWAKLREHRGPSWCRDSTRMDGDIPIKNLGMGISFYCPGVQGHSLSLGQRTEKFTSFHLFKLFTDTFFPFLSKGTDREPLQTMTENMAQTFLQAQTTLGAVPSLPGAPSDTSTGARFNIFQPQAES